MATYHDLLFKELLTTYLEDFLRLFVPQLFQEIEPGSLEFLDKELYPHQPRKRHHRSDLVARARVLGQTAHLLILLEHESRSTSTFPWRLFDYFARLYEDQQIPLYPIVIYSYVRPRRPGRSSFLWVRDRSGLRRSSLGHAFGLDQARFGADVSREPSADGCETLTHFWSSIVGRRSSRPDQ